MEGVWAQVANAPISKTGKIDRAHQRLAEAIDRLEASLAGAGAEPVDEGAAARLADEIGQLREENARLRRINDSVAGRLDDAIGRVRNALGETA